MCNVASHMQLTAVAASKLTWQSYLGNHMADLAADLSARFRQPKAPTCVAIEEWQGITHRVCQRLSFIEASRWDDIAPTVCAPEP